MPAAKNDDQQNKAGHAHIWSPTVLQLTTTVVGLVVGAALSYAINVYTNYEERQRAQQYEKRASDLETQLSHTKEAEEKRAAESAADIVDAKQAIQQLRSLLSSQSARDYDVERQKKITSVHNAFEYYRKFVYELPVIKAMTVRKIDVGLYATAHIPEFFPSTIVGDRHVIHDAVYETCKTTLFTTFEPDEYSLMPVDVRKALTKLVWIRHEALQCDDYRFSDELKSASWLKRNAYSSFGYSNEGGPEFYNDDSWEQHILSSNFDEIVDAAAGVLRAVIHDEQSFDSSVSNFPISPR